MLFCSEMVGLYWRLAQEMMANLPREHWNTSWGVLRLAASEKCRKSALQSAEEKLNMN